MPFTSPFTSGPTRRGNTMRRAAAAGVLAAMLPGSIAGAQTISIDSITQIRDGSRCNGSCPFSGFRDVTVINETVVPYTPPSPSGYDLIEGEYEVRFDGVTTLVGLDTSVGLSGSYHGSYPSTISPDQRRVPAPYAGADSLHDFPVISNFAYVVNSIDTARKVDGQYELYTPDPTAVINNRSVALAGRYASHLGTALTWGSLTGFASLDPQGPGLTLSYAVQAQAPSTVIDETGLVTPRVSVTQGIAMNGSKITGLAAGTAATDAVNKGQLDTETQARIAGDLQLSGDIATEASTRALADTALNQRILNEESARQQLAADLQSEANARAAADLSLGTQLGALGGRVDALGSRVAALEGRVASLEGRVDRLDRKIDASTATAVALSGNTFLPNTHFNLTANVATYGGAQAGAFQVGGMVSDNVAVNAGVATSLSKGGRTAGRVGFTVGW